MTTLNKNAKPKT